MIKFEDSEIRQVLPECIRNTPEAVSISYAIKNAIQHIIRHSRQISVYAAIDELPEKILDLIALEMRSQYYDEGLEIKKKREIIKNTLTWYQHAGTPSAVQELVEVVFGEGEVLEWFQYGGEPFHFKIISNADLVPGANVLFDNMIKKVKNTRSVLESIGISRISEAELYAGICHTSYSKCVIE